MINYNAGGFWYVLKIFQMRGSVFPSSFVVAGPCALVSAGLKMLTLRGFIEFLQAEDSVLAETQAWSGFSFLVGFLIVFRTSQAYSRFWDGCTSTHQMRAEWFDACSALSSFCKHSEAYVSPEPIAKFKHTLVRLFSMLHAACLAELEEINIDDEAMEHVQAFDFELIDPSSFDKDSIAAVKVSSSRVELVFSWIQNLIVENIGTGVLTIPPPILSRAFQEIANGMVAFHDAVKITYIPFPFPYAQTCDCLLIMHWVTVPFVTIHWVTSPVWAAILVFIQVFILWSLNFIAVEIENPFGTDANDLDGKNMQIEFNRQLLLLLQDDTHRVPEITLEEEWLVQGGLDTEKYCSMSFREVWRVVDDHQAAWTARKQHGFLRGDNVELQRPSTRPSPTPMQKVLRPTSIKRTSTCELNIGQLERIDSEQTSAEDETGSARPSARTATTFIAQPGAFSAAPKELAPKEQSLHPPVTLKPPTRTSLRAHSVPSVKRDASPSPEPNGHTERSEERMVSSGQVPVILPGTWEEMPQQRLLVALPQPQPQPPESRRAESPADAPPEMMTPSPKWSSSPGQGDAMVASMTSTR